MASAMKDGTKSPLKPLAIRQNNRLYHREAVARELTQATENRKQECTTQEKNRNKSTGRPSGFQYSFKSDGTLTGEEKWKENRTNNKEVVLPPPQQLNARMIWSLQKLQLELGASRTRYQQKQKLRPTRHRNANFG